MRNSTFGKNRSVAILGLILRSLEWRNWQTHGTQNPAFFTEHVGSTPTSSTRSTFIVVLKSLCYVSVSLRIGIGTYFRESRVGAPIKVDRWVVASRYGLGTIASA